jgi:hypothetical protein
MGAPVQEEALSLHPMRTAFLAYSRVILMGLLAHPIQIVRCVVEVDQILS